MSFRASLIQRLSDDGRDSPCVPLLRFPLGRRSKARSTRHCMMAVSGAPSVPPPSVLLREREGCFWMLEWQVSFPETSRMPLLHSFMG